MTETKPVEVEIEDIWIWRAERGQQLIRETRQGKPGPGHQDPHGDVIDYIGEQAAFKKANPRRFCGCPYDEAHAT
jgi:hypothetical protein